jgi:hypothetical protein
VGLIKSLFSPKITILLCVTIGLAPFKPEPHIWGKIKWIVGGANGMGFQDWLDVLLHGFPWLILPFSLAVYLKINKKQIKLN